MSPSTNPSLLAVPKGSGPEAFFGWTELATSAAGPSKAFYAALFGWLFEDEELPGGSVYTTILSAKGERIGALYELAEDQGPKRPAPHWLTFAAVSHAETTTLRAAALGGSVELPVFSLGTRGQMAIIRDPAGARLGLLQSGSPKMVAPEGEGVFCLRELASAFASDACAFYTELFGWTAESQAAGEGDYISLNNSRGMVAGLVAMDKRWSRHPAHWLSYVQVADAESSFAKAATLGAERLSDLIDIPGVCTYGVLRDPQGAVFALMALK